MHPSPYHPPPFPASPPLSDRLLGREDVQRRYPRAVLPPAIGPDGWDDGGDTYASFVARCQTLLTTIQGRFAPTTTWW